MDSLTDDFKVVMKNTWPIIIFICITIIILRLFWLKKEHKKIVLEKELPYLIFIIYILCLFQIVTSQDVSGVHGINVTFFKELTRYAIGTRLFYRNIVGNIVLFMPLGFFAGYLFKVNKKWLIFVLTGLISLSIEYIQLSIGRAFDVDDVILNVLGGMFGYLIYCLMVKCLKNFNERVKNIIITSFLVIVMVIILVVVVGGI